MKERRHKRRDGSRKTEDERCKKRTDNGRPKKLKREDGRQKTEDGIWKTKDRTQKTED